MRGAFFGSFAAAAFLTVIDPGKKAVHHKTAFGRFLCTERTAETTDGTILFGLHAFSRMGTGNRVIGRFGNHNNNIHRTNGHALTAGNTFLTVDHHLSAFIAINGPRGTHFHAAAAAQTAVFALFGAFVKKRTGIAIR